MSRKSHLGAAIICAIMPLVAAAQDEGKVYLPQFSQRTSICGEGAALTFTMQCDPGTRAPVDRVWMPAGAGLEICRVSETRCEPIRNPSASARPGFEVQDSGGGQLAVVGFGLDRLMGAAP